MSVPPVSSLARWRVLLSLPLLHMPALVCAQLDAVQVFDNLVADVLASEPHRQEPLILDWLMGNPHAPLVRADGTMIFVFHGQGKTVGVIGDMTQWREPLPMRRIGSTFLWVREARFERDARFDYRYVADGRWVVDPLNAQQSFGGYGMNSVWWGPDFRLPEALRPDTTPTLRGEDRTVRIDGRELTLHLPPGYADNPTRRFPTAYFLDGNEYRDVVEVGKIVDVEVERRRLQPTIAVFLGSDDRLLEYTLSDATSTWFATQLVPAIDRLVRTRTDPTQRLVVGSDLGAAMAAKIAYDHPELFAKVGIQSGNLTLHDDEVMRSLRDARPRPDLSFHVEVGTYETWVAGEDQLAAARRLRDALAARSYPTHYAELPRGHAWGFWRERMPHLLCHFFPAEGLPPTVARLTTER